MRMWWRRCARILTKYYVYASGRTTPGPTSGTCVCVCLCVSGGMCLHFKMPQRSTTIKPSPSSVDEKHTNTPFPDTSEQKKERRTPLWDHTHTYTRIKCTHASTFRGRCHAPTRRRVVFDFCERRWLTLRNFHTFSGNSGRVKCLCACVRACV